MRDTAKSGAGSVKDAVGTAAGKAKVPALAAGAAAAGLAGGVALGQRLLPQRKVLGVPLPRRSRVQKASRQLAKAAGEVGSAGRNVSELTAEVRRMREQVEQGNGRSPIEVVLSGLTRRRDP